MKILSNAMISACALALAWGCAKAPTHDAPSETKDILDRGSWDPADSPYAMMPGETLLVCDTGVKDGVLEYTIAAAEDWLELGGRQEMEVYAGCDGDRIIKLVHKPGDPGWYGQASPLRGNVHKLEVPRKWAGHWTANHEVGHVFGFAHNFDNISIMNSKNNGQYMNGGHLSDYDRQEVRRMLSKDVFHHANKAWGFDPTGINRDSDN